MSPHTESNSLTSKQLADAARYFQRVKNGCYARRSEIATAATVEPFRDTSECLQRLGAAIDECSPNYAKEAAESQAIVERAAAALTETPGSMMLKELARVVEKIPPARRAERRRAGCSVVAAYLAKRYGHPRATECQLEFITKLVERLGSDRVTFLAERLLNERIDPRVRNVVALFIHRCQQDQGD